MNKVFSPPIRKYMAKHIVANVLFNAALNAAIPYFLLQSRSIPLYGGWENLALSILPMFFLLPFIQSMVILYQTIVSSKKGKILINVPANSNRFLFRLGLLNGITSVLLASLIFFVCVYFHGQAMVSASFVIIMSSLLSGLMSIVFVIQPIYKLHKTKDGL